MTTLYDPNLDLDNSISFPTNIYVFSILVIKYTYKNELASLGDISRVCSCE